MLSRGNRAFVFYLVNMSYSPAGSPEEFIEFISHIVLSLRFACKTYIVSKLKNSLDIHVNFVLNLLHNAVSLLNSNAA